VNAADIVAKANIEAKKRAAAVLGKEQSSTAATLTCGMNYSERHR